MSCEIRFREIIKVDFIREVEYLTWLSNVVMVEKSNEKGRMCIDYTVLNKACPKDAYLLPNIDRLVDGAMWNPQNLKEVQKLTCRLESLSHFLPRIDEKVKPFFKLLKQPTDF